MTHMFYVNMVKREDGEIYACLEKTDGRIYLTPEAAQAAIDSDPDTTPNRHVVRLIAETPEEHDASTHCVEMLHMVLDSYVNYNIEERPGVIQDAEAALAEWWRS